MGLQKPNSYSVESGERYKKATGKVSRGTSAVRGRLGKMWVSC